MFKWIEVSPGRYKTVPLDDPRPGFPLKDKKGTPTIITAAPWAHLERDIAMAKTNEEQRAATDAFIAERDGWMQTSSKAKRWEESRKGEWAKHKPAWRKQKMKEGRIR